MEAAQILFFPHRLNRDGSYDSICLACLTTVANSREVANLDIADQNHVCDPTVLSQRVLPQVFALTALGQNLGGAPESGHLGSLAE
jgi:hypothetical protein